MGADFNIPFVISGDEIYFDNKPPEVERIVVAGAQTFTIRFSEEIGAFPSAGITLKDSGNNPLPGTLTFTADSAEAQFALAQSASTGVYSLQLSTGIVDQMSHSLAAFQQAISLASGDQLVLRKRERCCPDQHRLQHHRLPGPQ